jgi:hypothetical protein
MARGGMEMVRQGFSKLTEDIERQQNAMFRDALVGTMMEREATASVALSHDPNCQTTYAEDAIAHKEWVGKDDEYRKCSIIELPNLGAVFRVSDEEGGFIEGGLGIVNLDDYEINKVAELTYYDVEGVVYVRYRFPDDNVYTFFSTNDRWIVWQ